MGLSLFGKKATDADMCFLRDLMNVASAIQMVCGDAAMQLLIKPIIEERGLTEKLQNITKYVTINDCYPYDRNELMKNAETLFSMLDLPFDLDANKKAYIMNPIFNALKKMYLYTDEKRALISKYIYKGDKEYEENFPFLFDEYMSLF